MFRSRSAIDDGSGAKEKARCGFEWEWRSCGIEAVQTRFVSLSHFLGFRYLSVFLYFFGLFFLYCEGIGSSYVLSKREHWCLAFVERILLLGSILVCKSRKLDFWVCVFEKDVIRVRNFSIFRVYVGVGWPAAIQALKKQCHTGVS